MNDPIEAVAPQTIVNEQAEDNGLWFIAQTAPEAYLQQELRRLHASIENHHAARDALKARVDEALAHLAAAASYVVEGNLKEIHYSVTDAISALEGTDD